MKIEVGKVLKAQGIKGEIKVGCYLDSPAQIVAVKKLFVGNKNYNVLRGRHDGTCAYLLLEGIADRNMAEELRNWAVFANKEDIQLEEGRYFVDDLVGCTVRTTEGNTVATVTELLQYGAADVFVCTSDRGEISFPFLKDVVLKVDLATKCIVVDAKRFAEVVVTDED